MPVSNGEFAMSEFGDLEDLALLMFGMIYLRLSVFVLLVRKCGWRCSFGPRCPCALRPCLQVGVPSGATRRVQPLQLQEVVPSAYCRVSYSMLGLESDAKVQTLLICLFMSAVEVHPSVGCSGDRVNSGRLAS